MILIKSFLKGVFYDCFKTDIPVFNEVDKVRECYSCLKMMVQAHLHVGFFTIFFITRASLKRFYLFMKLFQSNTIFKQKIIMKCLVIKILHESFYNSQFKKYNCNSTHSNRKI